MIILIETGKCLLFSVFCFVLLLFREEEERINLCIDDDDDDISRCICSSYSIYSCFLRSSLRSFILNVPYAYKDPFDHKVLFVLKVPLNILLLFIFFFAFLILIDSFFLIPSFFKLVFRFLKFP